MRILLDEQIRLRKKLMEKPVGHSRGALSRRKLERWLGNFLPDLKACVLCSLPWEVQPERGVVLGLTRLVKSSARILTVTQMASQGNTNISGPCSLRFADTAAVK